MITTDLVLFPTPLSRLVPGNSTRVHLTAQRYLSMLRGKTLQSSDNEQHSTHSTQYLKLTIATFTLAASLLQNTGKELHQLNGVLQYCNNSAILPTCNLQQGETLNAKRFKSNKPLYSFNKALIVNMKHIIPAVQVN